MNRARAPERDVPELPQEIVDYSGSDNLILFIGAGVSRLQGCEGWEDLAARLLRKCRDNGFIHYKAFEYLRSLGDHRQLITICRRILEEHNGKGIFDDELNRALTPDEANRSTFPDISELVSRIHCHCIVTTNADQNLDKFFEAKIVTDFFPSTPDEGCLYHLHGSVADGNACFTLGDYFQRYKGDEIGIRTFLDSVFGLYHVLFIGYGLSEFELLEFVFRPPKNGLPEKGLRHFMLIGDSKDKFHKSYLQSYYDEMNIELIPYNMDVLGYDQLYHVIRSWSQQLEPASRYDRLLSDQERLQKCATEAYDPAAAKDVWSLLQRPDLESFFFNTLSNSGYETCRSWLVPLDKHKRFSAEGHPLLKQSEPSSPSDEVFWRPIGYLHKVAESAIRLQEHDVLDIIAGIGEELAEVLVRSPLRNYDWRTNSFVLQALLASKRVLSKPGMRRVALSLMTTEPASLLLGITVSDQLIRLLAQQGNRVALTMILDVSLRKLSVKQSDGSRDELAWDFEKTVVPHSAEIVHVCGLKAVRSGIDALRHWPEGSGFDLTYYWVPSVEESDQNADKTYSAPMAVVRFTRAACDQLPPEQRKVVAKQLLRSTASILRRVGYYLVNAHYKEMSTTFWEGRRNPLLDEDAFHEVYMLLLSHAQEIDSGQVEVFLRWLKKAQSAYRHESGMDNSTRTALGRRFKARWLLSVEASTDTRIRDLVSDSWSDRPRPTHPEWNFYIGKAERDMTGIVTSAILQEFETNEQLAAFLNATDVSSVYGALQEMVSNDPERLVTRGLNDLLGVPIGFLQAIFIGFMLAIQNKRIFKVDTVLQLSQSALTRLQISSEGTATKEDRSGVCRAICEFISTAVSHQLVSWTTENDTITRQLLQKAVKIASECPVTDPGLLKPRWRLANSALASAIKAIIFVAWDSKRARQGRKRSSNIPSWVAAILKGVLDYTDPVLSTEAREGIAAELYALNIVDTNWTSANLSQILPRELPDQWRDAFSSYLTAPVYQELFLLLRERGEYSLALAMRFPEEETEKSLASHVCLAYIYDLDDGLMAQMLDDGEEIRIGEVVWYFANRQREWTDPRRERLMQLWPGTIKAISRISDENKRTRLLSALPEWLNAFERLPASAEDLLEESFNGWGRQGPGGMGLLESLARFVEHDATRVGRILVSALKRDVVLAYPEDALVKIVETLCRQGLFGEAEEIHAAYSRKGIYVMGPVLRKWKKM